MANEYSIIIKAKLDSSNIKKELEDISTNVKLKVSKGNVNEVNKQIRSELKNIEVSPTIKLKSTVTKSSINSIQKDIKNGLKNIDVPVKINLKAQISKSELNGIQHSIKNALKELDAEVNVKAKTSATQRIDKVKVDDTKITSAANKIVTAVNRQQNITNKITNSIKDLQKAISTISKKESKAATLTGKPSSRYDAIQEEYLNQGIDAKYKNATNRLSGLVPDDNAPENIQARYQEAYKAWEKYGKLRNQLIGSLNADDKESTIKDFDRMTDQAKELDNILKMLKTDFDNYESSANAQAKELNASFESLLSVAKQISSLKIQQSKDIIKDNVGNVNNLQSQLDKLIAEYKEAYNAQEKFLNASQKDILNSTITTGNDNAEALKTNQAYKISLDTEVIDKQINALRTKIDKAFSNIDTLNSKDILDNDSYERLNNITNTAKSSLEGLVNLSNQLKSSISANASADKIISEYNQLDNVMKQVATDADKAASAISQINKSDISKYNAIVENISTGNLDSQISTLSKRYSSLNIGNFSKDNVNYNSVKDQIDKVVEAQKQLQDITSSSNKSDANSVREVINAYANYESALNTAKNAVNQLSDVQRQLANGMTAAQEAANLSAKISTWLNNNSAAEKEFGERLRDLQNKLKDVDGVSLRGLRQEFYQIQEEAVNAGKATQSLGSRLSVSLTSMIQYAGIDNIFSVIQQGMSKAWENVKNVDSAMVELKKVTDETSDSYAKFQDDAYKLSQRVGTSESSFINSAAGFARLGYSMEDAKGLAEQANIYYSVGDGLENIDEATTDLVSTLAAFNKTGKSSVDTAKNIVDVLDNVSNKESISMGGLGDILSRGGASMAAAGNSLEQTTALGVAMNRVAQDPDSVGTGLKTNNIVFVYRNVHNRTHLIAGKA